MLLGTGALALIYVVLGACYAGGVQGLPLLLLVLASIGAYAMSLAPVTWVVISEIFPNRIRGTAMSVAVAALWVACFILTYTFPILNARLGARARSGYMRPSVSPASFYLGELLETKGKTLISRGKIASILLRAQETRYLENEYMGFA